jgi:hypothetical protein
MAYTVSLADTFANTTEQLRGTLDNGYFVTSSESAGTITLSLYNVNDPTTVLDTDTSLLNTSGNAFLTAQNNSGSIYAQTYSDASNYLLSSIDESAGALVISNRGTFAVPTATYNQHMWLTPDGGQVLLRQNANGKRCVGLSTVDASQDFDLDTSSGHASGYGVAAFPASDRVITYCYTHDAFELWDGPGGTLLDSLDDSSFYFTPAGFPVAWPSIGTHNTFLVVDTDSAADPRELNLGVLLSSGDTLTMVWQTLGYVTNWAEADTTALQVASVWGGLVFFGVRTSASGSPISVYVVDYSTGDVYPSPAESAALPGIFDRSVGWAGPDYVVAFQGFVGTPDWTIWSVLAAAGPTYLRQRQSPVRAPSRVRGIDLRQRQTPIIVR